MRSYCLVFIIFNLCISSLYSVGITFSFAGAEVTGTHPNSYYEFDVMIQASESGSYLKDVQVYILYNPDAFGYNIYELNTNRLIVEKGVAINTSFYSALAVANNTDQIISISSNYFSDTYASLSYLVPPTEPESEPVQLVHVKMKIVEQNDTADLSFSMGNPSMAGQQFYFLSNSNSDPENAKYIPVTAIDTSDEPLPVTLSTFSGVQDGNCVQLNWITQSESNNWLWNVYRSNSSAANSSFQHNGMPIWGAGTTSVPTQYSYQDDEIEDLPFVTYYYWLESVDYDGDSELFGPISLIYSTNNEDISAPELKKESLFSSYPNPFNPSTNIDIIAAEDTKADLTIYNSKGQFVDTIFKNKYLEKDSYESFFWDGKSHDGSELPNGVYLAKLAYGNKIKTHRMILLK